ncbi:hypothetical protein L9F63_023822, partial [Diploptera punctata]
TPVLFQIVIESKNVILQQEESCSEGVEAHSLPGFTDNARAVVAVYCVLFSVAAIGNLSVFLTLLRARHRKSRVSLLMTHLAAADLIVTFVMIPLEVGWRVTTQWLAGNLACKLFLFLRAFGLYLSSNILVCISLDRYFAIIYPLKVSDARRRGKLMLSFAWFTSLLCSYLRSTLIIHAQRVQFFFHVQCIVMPYFDTDRQAQRMYRHISALPYYFRMLLIIILNYPWAKCFKDFRAVGRGREACSSPTFRQRLRLASSRVVLRLAILSAVCLIYTFRQRTELPVSRQPLRMPDAVSGETSGNYKPHDHGLQPENLLQDHQSNSGRESLPSGSKKTRVNQE